MGAARRALEECVGKARKVKSRWAWLVAWAVLLGAPLPAAGDHSVALLLGQEVRVDEAEGSSGPVAQVQQLFERLWPPLARHYRDENNLAATAAEIEEAATYHREFDRLDRAQRGRKLAELNQRLAVDNLGKKDRAWLEDFRAVLVRLERRDSEMDREPPPDPRQRDARLATWIEMWKVNRALYEQYGGIVALTRFGPDPKGARAALFADYERSGWLTFEDRGLRDRLFEWLEARPTAVIRPEDVDFTPYWKRPIPPSYFPD